jgi:hypothetical protein
VVAVVTELVKYASARGWIEALTPTQPGKANDSVPHLQLYT